MKGEITAGSSQVEITPLRNCFLWGYPHQNRISTGVWDPLMSSSLYLSDGKTQLLFISNDIIFVSKELCRRVRKGIHNEIGFPVYSIIISATHTHSGPAIVNMLSNECDPTVPPVDNDYMEYLIRKAVRGACEAVRCATKAEVGQAHTKINGVGTNRLNPDGPNDNQASIIHVRTRGAHESIACMIVYGMHPTVLHEDSTVISADFPGVIRRYLQDKIIGENCPILYHNGVCGNLSPRHVTKSNTIEEMTRLGNLAAQQIEAAIVNLQYRFDYELHDSKREIEIKLREFPSIETAQKKLDTANKRYLKLINEGADAAKLRTAECAVFGAEETLALASTVENNRIIDVANTCNPAELRLYTIGDSLYLTWPGEIFVEYSLALKSEYSNLTIISMANGELQGYIATSEAVQNNEYEATNALFSHENGRLFIENSKEMIRNHFIKTGVIFHGV